MTTCNKNNDKVESTFIQFSRTLLNTFVLLVVITLVLALKNRLISENATLFYTTLFIIGATILFTIIGTIDNYVYSQLILGIGMALGLQIMDWRINK